MFLPYWFKFDSSRPTALEPGNNLCSEQPFVSNYQERTFGESFGRAKMFQNTFKRRGQAWSSTHDAGLCSRSHHGTAEATLILGCSTEAVKRGIENSARKPKPIEPRLFSGFSQNGGGLQASQADRRHPP